jgi:dienelactone hydrolase
MTTHTAPAPQRIWEIGKPNTDPHPPARSSAAARLTAVAAVVFAASGAASGRLIDASGGVVDIAAIVTRTVVVAAAAVALIGGFVVLAQAARRVRRRAVRWASIAGLWIAFAWLVAIPVGYAVYLTHLPARRAVHDVDLGAPKEPVALQGSDGVTLRGWYVPSRNRAAVVALHGTGSNRTGVAAHARMLVRHGYGVLAVDLRGHGQSGGRSTSVPWKLDDDLDAAVVWLSRRGDVDRRRIAALGVSLGAEVALQAAARRDDVRAVVAEGVLGSGLADMRSAGADVASVAQIAVNAATTRVLAGEGPAASDGELVERIAPRPVLLISAGGREERIARAFARRGGPAAQRWDLPHAAHGAAIRTDPRGYERRVVAFLHSSLRTRG